MADIQQQITEEQAKLDAILKEQRETLQANNGIQLEAEGLQARVDRLTKDVADKQTELDNLNANLDSASVARSGILTDLDAKRLELGAAQSDLDVAITAKNKADADRGDIVAGTQVTQDAIIADARATVEAITKEKDALEQQLAPLTDQVARFRDEITNEKNVLAGLNTQIIDATGALDDLLSRQKLATDLLQSLNDKAAAIQSNIDSKNAELDTATKNLSDIQDQTVKAQADLDTVKKELETNNQYNDDFLKMRGELLAAIEVNKERTDFLKQKYGDLGETFN